MMQKLGDWPLLINKVPESTADSDRFSFFQRHNQQ